MNSYTLRIGLALGLLICGDRTVVAQQLTLPVPILIHLGEIDRCGVSLCHLPETLALPYQAMSFSEVVTLVSNGIAMHQPVIIMDGNRLIAKSSVLGVCLFQPDRLDTDPSALTKYGLILRFESAEEAKRVEAILRVDSVDSTENLDRLIRNSYKKLMNDKSYLGMGI